MSEVLTSDIRHVANRQYSQSLKPAVQDFNDLMRNLRSANDASPVTVDLIYAAEWAAKQFKEFSSALRAALCEEMQLTGEFEVAGSQFIASLRSGAVSAEVVDEALLREEKPSLFIPQPDKLDRAKLTQMLKLQASVPGAKLSQSAPTLALRKA